jgi:2-dehydropantoate 2-reductase
MRIAVMGAGGIGSFYGGLLARAGEDVTFIARGAHLAALRSGGLEVLRDRERFRVRPVQATDDPAAVGPVELVLLATKAYDLEAALEAMAPLVGPESLVLPLLNGVDMVERVARRVPAGQVLAGLTYVPANRPRPGAVHQPGPERRLLLGEPRGPATERCRRVLAVLQGAGIRAEVSDAMPVEIWSKFMLVTANGGVCGVTGSPIGPVLADPDTRALYIACCREVQALAAALGVALPPDAVQRTVTHAEGTPADNRPSLLQDLEQGKPLELEALNGTVARLGRARGVPVPVNASIYAALKLRAGGRSP